MKLFTIDAVLSPRSKSFDDPRYLAEWLAEMLAEHDIAASLTVGEVISRVLPAIEDVAALPVKSKVFLSNFPESIGTVVEQREGATVIDWPDERKPIPMAHAPGGFGSYGTQDGPTLNLVICDGDSSIFQQVF